MFSCARLENMLALTIWGAVLVFAIALLGVVWWLRRPKTVVVNASTPFINLDDPMERKAFVDLLRRLGGAS